MIWMDFQISVDATSRVVRVQTRQVDRDTGLATALSERYSILSYRTRFPGSAIASRDYILLTYYLEMI